MGDLLAQLRAAQPLEARVSGIEGTVVRAGIGTFHGAREGEAYRLVRRLPTPGELEGDYRTVTVGEVRLTEAGTSTSSFRAETAPEEGEGDLWVVEQAPEAPQAP